jgi:hypothetical protein
MKAFLLLLLLTAHAGAQASARQPITLEAFVGLYRHHLMTLPPDQRTPETIRELKQHLFSVSGPHDSRQLILQRGLDGLKKAARAFEPAELRARLNETIDDLTTGPIRPERAQADSRRRTQSRVDLEFRAVNELAAPPSGDLPLFFAADGTQVVRPRADQPDTRAFDVVDPISHVALSSFVLPQAADGVLANGTLPDHFVTYDLASQALVYVDALTRRADPIRTQAPAQRSEHRWLSPDGNWVADFGDSAIKGSFRLIDRRDPARWQTLDEKYSQRIRFSEDSQEIAGRFRRTLWIHRVGEPGVPRAEVNLNKVLGNAPLDADLYFAIRADELTFLVSSRSHSLRSTVVTWDRASERVTQRLSLPEVTESLHLLPDGRHVIAVRPDHALSIQIYDTRTKQMGEARLPKGMHTLVGGKVTSDGRYLVLRTLTQTGSRSVILRTRDLISQLSTETGTEP